MATRTYAIVHLCVFLFTLLFCVHGFASAADVSDMESESKRIHLMVQNANALANLEVSNFAQDREGIKERRISAYISVAVAMKAWVETYIEPTAFQNTANTARYAHDIYRVALAYRYGDDAWDAGDILRRLLALPQLSHPSGQLLDVKQKATSLLSGCDMYQAASNYVPGGGVSILNSLPTLEERARREAQASLEEEEARRNAEVVSNFENPPSADLQAETADHEAEVNGQTIALFLRKNNLPATITQNENVLLVNAGIDPELFLAAQHALQTLHQNLFTFLSFRPIVAINLLLTPAPDSTTFYLINKEYFGLPAMTSDTTISQESRTIALSKVKGETTDAFGTRVTKATARLYLKADVPKCPLWLEDALVALLANKTSLTSIANSATLPVKGALKVRNRPTVSQLLSMTEAEFHGPNRLANEGIALALVEYMLRQHRTALNNFMEDGPNQLAQLFNLLSGNYDVAGENVFRNRRSIVYGEATGFASSANQSTANLILLVVGATNKTLSLEQLERALEADGGLKPAVATPKPTGLRTPHL